MKYAAVDLVVVRLPVGALEISGPETDEHKPVEHEHVGCSPGRSRIEMDSHWSPDCLQQRFHAVLGCSIAHLLESKTPPDKFRKRVAGCRCLPLLLISTDVGHVVPDAASVAAREDTFSGTFSGTRQLAWCFRICIFGQASLEQLAACCLKLMLRQRKGAPRYFIWQLQVAQTQIGRENDLKGGATF